MLNVVTMKIEFSKIMQEIYIDSTIYERSSKHSQHLPEEVMSEDGGIILHSHRNERSPPYGVAKYSRSGGGGSNDNADGVNSK